MLNSNLKANQSLTTHISSPPKFVVAKKQRTIKKIFLFQVLVYIPETMFQ